MRRCAKWHWNRNADKKISQGIPRDALVPAFRRAIATVEDSAVAVVDVNIEPGYTVATAAGLIRTVK